MANVFAGELVIYERSDENNLIERQVCNQVCDGRIRSAVKIVLHLCLLTMVLQVIEVYNSVPAWVTPHRRP